jgi:glutathione S-transferase
MRNDNLKPEVRMKIYDFKLAPNPRRVRIFLAEKGISVPLEEIDILKGVNRQPEFLRKNPLGGIPLLELDDGRFIAESVAICRYFEELHPEPALFGSGAFERATVEMWNRRIELALFVPVGMVWAHLHELTRTRIKQIPEFGEQQREVVEGRYRWLNRELAERPFVAATSTRSRISPHCARSISPCSTSSRFNPTRRTWRDGIRRFRRARAQPHRIDEASRRGFDAGPLEPSRDNAQT